MNMEFTMRRRFAMIQRAASGRGKKDGEVGSSRPPTDDEYEGYLYFKGPDTMGARWMHWSGRLDRLPNSVSQ
jgi:hypothetical protein